MKTRQSSHNSLQNFLQKFKHKFTVQGSHIDIKDMSQNYPNGLIPLEDIAQAVDAVIGPWQGRINRYQGIMNLTPKFEMIPKSHIYSHSTFNRDTSPNHCLKLEEDWLEQFGLVSLGVKLPEKYGLIVLNCDSTHTGTNRIRKNDEILPFWICEIPDQGDFKKTFDAALLMAGHLFLAINVRNKRGVDIFDQHNIKAATGIYPAPQINDVISKVSPVIIKRASVKIPYAIHNLNEVQLTFELDSDTHRPGRLLEKSLRWLVRNFKHQSIDGCLQTSFALFIQTNESANIKHTDAELDSLAAELNKRFQTARNTQLKIKEACILLNKKKNPSYKLHDNNYVVSNGLYHIAQSINLPTVPDSLRQWEPWF